MSRLKIAQWSYRVGCLCAVAAVAYRALMFGGLGLRLYGFAHVLPTNLLQLSILLLVISIATNAEAMANR
jgi:hypothetical protein